MGANVVLQLNLVDKRFIADEADQCEAMFSMIPKMYIQLVSSLEGLSAQNTSGGR
jgi:hypothetical protein